MLGLLKEALESSRYALGLKPEDPDVLFNTAQCLTSLSEAADDASPASGGERDAEGLGYLEEAYGLFERCMKVQEQRYSESQAMEQAAASGGQEDMSAEQDTEEGSVSLGGAGSGPPGGQQEEQWASIVEPVTADSLIDTLLATIESLTALCAKIPPSPNPYIETIAQASSTMYEKLGAYLPSSPDHQTRSHDASLLRANFEAALLDARYRHGSLPFDKYHVLLGEAYAALHLETDPKGLSDMAESLINFQSSVRVNFADEPNAQPKISARWSALTAALKALAAASKLPDVQNLARIHLTRGDAELWRYQIRRISGWPSNVDPAVMLKNAGVYYRGSAAQVVGPGDREGERTQGEAQVKAAVVKALSEEGVESLMELVRRNEAVVREVVEDMVGEGLVMDMWVLELMNQNKELYRCLGSAMDV
jgi:hypothetical protein